MAMSANRTIILICILGIVTLIIGIIILIAIAGLSIYDMSPGKKREDYSSGYRNSIAIIVMGLILILSIPFLMRTNTESKIYREYYIDRELELIDRQLALLSC